MLETFESLGRRLAALESELVGVLRRFTGYTDRYDAALARVVDGANQWVDGVGFDSLHAVWMQLHEDLIATLGIDRATGLTPGE